MKTFSHGIHPPEKKHYSAMKAIKRFPFAPMMTLFLSQHAGRPSIAIVRKGESISRGQIIAKADGFMSVPMHSPVTGKVKSINRAMNGNGEMAEAIIIETNLSSVQDMTVGYPEEVQKVLRPENLDKQEIIERIKSSGMVGLGGAAFPTHVKFSPPPGKTVKTLIVNGCECEPYLTSDHRVMLEYSELVIEGTCFALKALSAEEAVIAIESNKEDAYEALKKALATLRASHPKSEFLAKISIELVKTKYPQGAEKMLVSALLGKEIPSAKLPADAEVMISNVATLAEIALLVPAGRGLVERVVTVTGNGVKNPGNYIIPIGTPLDFLLESLELNGEIGSVLFGGPMMGKTVAFLGTPISKSVSGIVVTKKETKEKIVKINPCIKCASCVSACPIHLNPSRLGLLARKSFFEEMRDDFNLFDCFECGSCSFVCPSNIPLVQLFRMSKGTLRKMSA